MNLFNQNCQQHEVDLKDSKILIVDDQVANIEVLEDLLLIKGYENINPLRMPEKC